MGGFQNKPQSFVSHLSSLCFHLLEVRCQLTDQLKMLDLQLEQKSQQLQDLTDYLRRRGEIESEYARSLEKLAEKFTSRIKRWTKAHFSVADIIVLQRKV